MAYDLAFVKLISQFFKKNYAHCLALTCHHISNWDCYRIRCLYHTTMHVVEIKGIFFNVVGKHFINDVSEFHSTLIHIDVH